MFQHGSAQHTVATGKDQRATALMRGLEGVALGVRAYSSDMQHAIFRYSIAAAKTA